MVERQDISESHRFAGQSKDLGPSISNGVFQEQQLVDLDRPGSKLSILNLTTIQAGVAVGRLYDASISRESDSLSELSPVEHPVYTGLNSRALADLYESYARVPYNRSFTNLAEFSDYFAKFKNNFSNSVESFDKLLDTVAGDLVPTYLFCLAQITKHRSDLSEFNNECQKLSNYIAEAYTRPASIRSSLTLILHTIDRQIELNNPAQSLTSADSNAAIGKF